MEERVREAVELLNKRYLFTERVAIILGSGISIFEENIIFSIGYNEIPSMAKPMVPGHKGRLEVVDVDGERVVILRGRFHLYEGYSAKEVVFPIEVVGNLGIRLVIVTNASGGINKNLSPGDIMLISDHINLMSDSPLIGHPYFIDMKNAYSLRERILLKEVGRDLSLELKEGVYIGVKGPNYETPAEVRFFRMIGGDAVGMSTVPEVIMARKMGIEVLGISCITNVHRNDSIEVTHNEVLKIGERISKDLERLLREYIKRRKG
ncbi:MAG: purine-nucleoside phosphorylase [bacterium]